MLSNRIDFYIFDNESMIYLLRKEVKMKLLVLLYDKFNDMELTTTLSVLHRSGQAVEFSYVSPITNSKNQDFEVIGQHGVVKIMTHPISVDPKNYDAIFIPGGAQAKELRKDEIGLNIIRDFQTAGKYIFAICDAPNALKDSNIISEEQYSSYPLHADKTWIPGNKRSNEITTVHDKLVTGKSPYSAYEFGLTIVEVLYGKNIAQNTRLFLNGDYKSSNK